MLPVAHLIFKTGFAHLLKFHLHLKIRYLSKNVLVMQKCFRLNGEVLYLLAVKIRPQIWAFLEHF